VIEKYSYDAFGAPTTTYSGGSFNNRFKFTGREYASNFGIYEYRNRAYHPGIGRFISEDPKGFDGGDKNLFRYVGNDPLNRVDPMGLDQFITGYDRITMVRSGPTDATHDGWEMKGSHETPPGQVQLEVNRTVRRVPSLDGRGADTTAHSDTRVKNGDPTIQLQLDVRYATEAGYFTQRKTNDEKTGEWAISDGYLSSFSDLRAKRNQQVQARGLSPDAAVAFIRNGNRSGPVLSQTGSLQDATQRAHHELALYWEVAWPYLKSPKDVTYSRHTPLDDNGEPVTDWRR
jgi:RHS repeat-associated protein